MSHQNCTKVILLYSFICCYASWWSFKTDYNCKLWDRHFLFLFCCCLGCLLYGQGRALRLEGHREVLNADHPILIKGQKFAHDLNLAPKSAVVVDLIPSISSFFFLPTQILMLPEYILVLHLKKQTCYCIEWLNRQNGRRKRTSFWHLIH